MPSEREKMLAGELYRASDPELARARLRAQQILMRYNATQPIELDLRSSILTELFASLGHNSEVKPHFACDYGLNIQLGRNVFVNYGCVFLDCGFIVLGDDVQIGPAVQIYTATHPIDPVVRRTGLEAARPVRIGSNVWIGGAAVVLPGVTIGDDAVIGAGSVVTTDVPNGAVVVGNPARPRRTAT
jgi:maltose O-acetyltransferase